MRKAYLGEAPLVLHCCIHATSTSNGCLELTVEDGESVINRIVLDPEAIQSLILFLSEADEYLLFLKTRKRKKTIPK
jgi:hypothetical protein